MKSGGGFILDTLGGLALKGQTYGTAGYISIGKPAPTTVNIHLTQVTEIASDYLLLNPNDSSPDIPGPGVDNGAVLQWKDKRLKYSYDPNTYGAIQNIELHCDQTGQEKTFTCSNLEMSITQGE